MCFIQRRICFHCCLKKINNKYVCHKFVKEYPPKTKKDMRSTNLTTGVRHDHWCTGVGSITIYDYCQSNQCLARKSTTLGPEHHPKNVCTDQLHVGCCVTFPTVNYLLCLIFL